MQNQKAAVREAVERIPGVTRTWFEWVLEGGELLKRLVVEVSFDTDPASPTCRRNALEAIRDTVIGFLENETTMIVKSHEGHPCSRDSSMNLEFTHPIQAVSPSKGRGDSAR